MKDGFYFCNKSNMTNFFTNFKTIVEVIYYDWYTLYNKNYVSCG